MEFIDPRRLQGPTLQRNRDYSRQRQMGIGDMLLDNRVVFLGTFGSTLFDTTISDPLANVTIQQLLYLQYENRTQEIHFYINSPGGSVSAMLAIYDTMQFLECPIATYCVGEAASAAAVLLAGGTKGKRFALPNSRIMLHEAHWGFRGQATDVNIAMKEFERTQAILNRILSKHTGRADEEISKAIDRERWFTPVEAKEFGLIDEVLDKPKK